MASLAHPHVLVSDPLAKPGLDCLATAGLHVDVRPDMEPAALLRCIGDYDALIVRSGTQVTADVIQAADNLRVIARAGVGIDNIDVDAATQRGIIVVNAPTGNVGAAAEHTVALLLALARHIPHAYDSMRRGEWNRKAFMGTEVRDKTLGTIGLGRVASQVVRRAVGLGMKIMAYDPFVGSDYAANLGVQLVSLETLLCESDFISVHLPLNDSTHHMLNAERLRLCKSGAYLINTSRGGVIDEQALLATLDADHLAGVALDVFTTEPLPSDSPLRRHPRLILTPHIGGSTTEAQYQVAMDVANQVIDVLNGRSARYAVNAPLIPSSDIEWVMPFVSLVETLGRFLYQYQPMQVESVELTIHGPLADHNTQILQAAALRGLLAQVTEERVNEVNADIIAQRRGIIISELRQRHHYERFENMVTLRIAAGEQSASVRGSILGDEPYIVAIDDLWVDFVARGHFFLSWHIDHPGVIGKIGTVLGQNDINIAFMHVGRRSPREDTIMVLNTDEPIPDHLIPHLLRIVAIHRACTILL
ncbi:MAG: phosphoglycerate dehydrogenase [Chloroflexi bacterium]|nr:phosphoglycerate dehydrogenase [Chloroflexota bacterium]